MNNYKIIIYYIIQFTWGIIQNLLGFILFIILYPFDKNNMYLFNGSIVYKWRLKSSLSLGIFIFLGENSLKVLVHEYGHTIQSCILGPLYLFVIGIPSFIWCNNPRFEKNRIKGKYTYSYFYSEAWANKLGRRYTGLPSIDI